MPADSVSNSVYSGYGAIIPKAGTTINDNGELTIGGTFYLKYSCGK